MPDVSEDGCVTENVNPNRARDHLANERTFLAWVRTAGLSVWMGAGSIVAGVALVVAGLLRYRKTRAQLEVGTFEPAGFVVDLVTILMVVFGLMQAGYLIYTEKSLG